MSGGALEKAQDYLQAAAAVGEQVSVLTRLREGAAVYVSHLLAGLWCFDAMARLAREGLKAVV